MQAKKRSFFEKLTGAGNAEDEYDEEPRKISVKEDRRGHASVNDWLPEEEEAELAVDVYQTPAEIIIQTMVAGVKPEDLELSIGRDTVTIRGKREETRIIDENNYFAKELYWGSFSRTISLPQEVEPEEAEATERHGLLTIRLKKIDRDRKANLKVKSL